MQPVCVVKADDVVGNVGGGLCMVGVVQLPNPLHLQVQEEAFHHRIIPAVALAAHAGDQAMAGQQVAVGLAGVLAASVGMHD